MCGIVGYVGPRACRELLLEGLEKLEYRGYDSAGVSVLEGDRIDSVRAVGNLSVLRAEVTARTTARVEDGSITAATATADVCTGIGHTRWATHGRVTESNAHPHFDNSDRIHIVLNGIVENHVDLHERLEADGVTFTSETDAEVVAHLISVYYDGDLVSAVRRAYAELRGHYAFVAMAADEPGVLVGVRNEVPLVLGVADDEQFIASAIPAFLKETRRVKLLNDDEFAIVRPEGTEILDLDGNRVERDAEEVDWDETAAEKGGYETFMLKEIHEQSDAVAETIGDRLTGDGIELGEIGISDDELRALKGITIVACGTSYHAGVVARYAIEEWARVPVQPDIASEWIYRRPVLDPGTLVIGISQSGETRDTIQAMKLARENGARTVAITNMMGSQITREVDSVLYTRTGLEVGVAASKTFTAQAALLLLIGLKLAQCRSTLPESEVEFILDEVYDLPEKMQRFLDGDHPIEEIAQRFHDRPFFLYLGRHIGLPVALEGALKLKEISYIPTEAYSAGEMKHGPIALLEEGTPVVVVATNIHVYDKIVSNIQETRARGAHVIAIATDGNEDIQHHADDVIYVP